MQNDVFTVEEFHQLAENKGLSNRQIRRLIENRLFPETKKIGLGRGKGCQYVYQREAERQLDVIVKVKKKVKKFQYLRILMWFGGLDWVWEDLRTELLSELQEPPSYEMEDGELCSSALFDIDRQITTINQVYSKISKMKEYIRVRALWEIAWLRILHQPYPYQGDSESGDKPLSQFFGHAEADSLLPVLALAYEYNNVKFVVENASAAFAARVKPFVLRELQLGLPKMPVPEKVNPTFYWTKLYIIVFLVLEHTMTMSTLNNPEIMRARFEEIRKETFNK